MNAQVGNAGPFQNIVPRRASIPYWAPAVLAGEDPDWVHVAATAKNKKQWLNQWNGMRIAIFLILSAKIPHSSIEI
jgi:hypothetical protein